MTEQLAQNLLTHQQQLVSYLNTNLLLNSATLLVLVLAVWYLWQGYAILKRLERKVNG